MKGGPLPDLGFALLPTRSSTCSALQCDHGMEYDPCGPACPPTCQNFGLELTEHCPMETASCVEGCFCPEGKVLHGEIRQGQQPWGKGEGGAAWCLWTEPGETREEEEVGGMEGLPWDVGREDGGDQHRLGTVSFPEVKAMGSYSPTKAGQVD